MRFISKKKAIAFALCTIIIVGCVQNHRKQQEMLCRTRTELHSQRIRIRNKIETLNEYEFRYIFRMPRPIFHKLVEDLTPLLEKRGISAKAPSMGVITPSLCVAAALHYWGAGVMRQILMELLNHRADRFYASPHRIRNWNVKSCYIQMHSANNVSSV